jgi:hypothetical protein
MAFLGDHSQFGLLALAHTSQRSAAAIWWARLRTGFRQSSSGSNWLLGDSNLKSLALFEDFAT